MSRHEWPFTPTAIVSLLGTWTSTRADTLNKGRSPAGRYMLRYFAILSLGLILIVSLGNHRLLAIPMLTIVMLYGTYAVAISIHLSYRELDLTPRGPKLTPSADLRPSLPEKPKYDAVQSVFFAMAVINPAEVTDRIREVATPLTRAIQIRRYINIAVPSGTVPLFYPASIQRKGDLRDNLAITSTDGSQCGPISQSEVAELALCAVQNMIGNVHLTPETRMDILQIIIQGSNNTESIPVVSVGKVVEKIQDACGANSQLTPEDVEIARDSVTKFLTLLSDNYCTVVQLAPRSYTWMQEISLEYRLIQDLRLPPQIVGPSRPASRLTYTDLYMWAFIQIRNILGVRPSDITFEVANAARCKSYHAEVYGLQGTYLARQKLNGVSVRDGVRAKVTFTEGTPSAQGEAVQYHAQYHRLRKRGGQRYCHLYIRGGTDKILQDSMRLRMGFYERPPGATGITAISSFASTALVLTTAWVMSHAVHPAGDLLAVLLAFPFVAATGFGIDSAAGPIGGVLAAKLGALLTAVISTVAAVSAVGYLPLGVPFDFEFLGSRGTWPLLVITSLLTSLAMLASWIRRAAIYSKFVTRPASGGQNGPVVADEAVET